MIDAVIQELCRRRFPDALATMLTVVVTSTASPPVRLAALYRLANLVEGKVVSADAFRTALAAARVTDAEWAAAVRELRR